MSNIISNFSIQWHKIDSTIKCDKFDFEDDMIDYKMVIGFVAP